MKRIFQYYLIGEPLSKFKSDTRAAYRQIYLFLKKLDISIASPFRTRIALILVFPCLNCLSTVAQTSLSDNLSLNTIQKLIGYDRNSEGLSSGNNRFTYSMAVDGDYAVIGAREEDYGVDGLDSTYLQSAGSAYILKRASGAWFIDQKILPSQRLFAGFFGESVAISGDYLFVGSLYGDAELIDRSSSNYSYSTGSVHVFKKGEEGRWEEHQVLYSSDAEQSDWFGSSLSVDGNYLVVGAVYEDDDVLGENDLSKSGSAYVFELQSDTWVEVQKLIADDRQAVDYFGKDVSISGDYILVGAPYEDEDESGENTMRDEGSAYIFQKLPDGSWSQVQKLVASDRVDNSPYDAQFGTSVAINDSMAIIGAPTPSNYTNFGKAYIYKLSASGAWRESAILEVPENKDVQVQYRSFSLGNDVDIDGKIAVAGAAYYGDNHGAAFVYKEHDSEWSFANILLHCDPTRNDYSGWTVAIGESEILMGSLQKASYNEENEMTGEGALYIFSSQGVEFSSCNSYLTVSENQDSVGLVQAFDTLGNIATYSIYGGVDGSLFEIDEISGVLSFIASPDFENPTDSNQDNKYTVVVAATTADFSGQASYTIEVLDVDFNASNLGIDSVQVVEVFENQDSVASVILTDTSGAVIEYYLTGGIDSVLFEISSTGLLSFKSVPNFENPLDYDLNNLYHVVTGVTDGTDSLVIEFQVRVLDDDDGEEPRNPSLGIPGFKLFNGNQQVISTDAVGQAQDLNNRTLFGRAVDIDGEYAIMGDPSHDYEAGPTTLNDAGAAYIFKKQGNSWVQHQKLVPSSQGINANFGITVSISGDYAVIGAPSQDKFIDNVHYDQMGSAYIFKRNASDEWEEVQELTSIDRRSIIRFGASVDLNDDYLVIGAPNERGDLTGNDNSPREGVAYVYQRDEAGVWNLQERLVPTLISGRPYFGWDVAIDPTGVAVVGALQDDYDVNGERDITDNGTPGAGSAYIFKKDGEHWIQSQKVVASDRLKENEVLVGSTSYGQQVAIHGTTIAVGSGASYGGSGSAELRSSGAVYLLEKNTDGLWVETQKVTPTFRSEGANFGMAIDIYDNKLVVGAHQESYDELNDNYLILSGAIYLFQRTENSIWVQTKKMVPCGRTESDHFGRSVAVDETSIIASHSGAKNEKRQLLGGSAIIYQDQAITLNFCSSLSIPENTDTVTYFNAADTLGSALNYYLSGGVDSTYFSIDEVTGLLRFKSAPNFEYPLDEDSENNYEILLLLTNGTDSLEVAATIFVTDVEEVTADPTNSNTAITASPSSIRADGASTSTIIVQLADADGQLLTVSGGTITLSTSIGSLNEVTDNQDGTYTATLTSGTTSGLATVSAMLDGMQITNTAEVTFTEVADPTHENTTITANPESIAADGLSTSTITVQLADNNGDLLTSSGGTVVLTTTLGSLSDVTDNNDGSYTATLTSETTTGTATLSGTLDGVTITSTEEVLFMSNTAPTTADTTIVLAKNAEFFLGANNFPFADADGDVLTNVTIQTEITTGSLRLENGEVDDFFLPPVTLSLADLSRLVYSPPVDQIGDALSSFEFTVSDGTDESSAGTLSISIVEGVSVSILNAPALYNNDSDSFTVTIQFSEDVEGFTVEDMVVVNADISGFSQISDSQFDVTLTPAQMSDPLPDDFDPALRIQVIGNAAFAVADGEPNQSAMETVNYNLSSADPTNVNTTITANPTTIDADGSSTSNVTVQLANANGDLLTASGGEVTLSTSLGSLSGVTDNGDGSYSATLTSSTTAGVATVSGQLEGIAISSTIEVTFQAQVIDVTVSLSATTIGEAGGAIVLTATADEVLATDVVIDLALGAGAAEAVDFITFPSSLTILAGQSTASVDIEVADDADVEGDEAALFEWSTASAEINLTSSSASVTITDNDQAFVILSFSNNIVDEAIGTVTIQATATSPLPVEQVIDVELIGVNATEDDFVTIPATIVFAANSITASATLEIADDGNIEGDETARFHFSSGSSLLLFLSDQLDLTIQDNDLVTSSPVPTAVKIYPTNAVNDVHIALGDMNPSSIEVFSLSGQRALQLSGLSWNETVRMDISQLTPGVYILHIRDANTGQVISKKFIKN